MTASVRGCRRVAVASGAVVVLVSIGLAAGAQAASQRKLREPSRQSVSRLYVLNAARGTLRRSVHRGLVLRLRGVERRAVWFADRPARRSGSLPSAALVASWKGIGFAADRPVAALDYTDSAGRQRTAILKLSHPRYATRARVLSLRARLLNPRKVKGGNLASHARAADRTPAHHFGATSLFIAEATAPVINGCVIEPYTLCPGANLAYADLSGADLTGAVLTKANLSGANLSGANLTAAALTAAYAAEANLTDANLTKANVTGTYLASADLTAADLPGADLAVADLTFAILVGADLTNANLTNAGLLGANLTNANLTGANLSGATFCYTTMPDGSINDNSCQSQLSHAMSERSREIPGTSWTSGDDPHALPSRR